MSKKHTADEDDSLKADDSEDENMIEFLPEDTEYDESEELEDDLEPFDVDDVFEANDEVADDGRGDEHFRQDE